VNEVLGCVLSGRTLYIDDQEEVVSTANEWEVLLDSYCVVFRVVSGPDIFVVQ